MKWEWHSENLRMIYPKTHTQSAKALQSAVEIRCTAADYNLDQTTIVMTGQMTPDRLIRLPDNKLFTYRFY